MNQGLAMDTSEIENPLKEVWMSLGSAEAIRNGRRRRKGIAPGDKRGYTFYQGDCT